MGVRSPAKYGRRTNRPIPPARPRPSADERLLERYPSGQSYRHVVRLPDVDMPAASV